MGPLLETTRDEGYPFSRRPSRTLNTGDLNLFFFCFQVSVPEFQYARGTAASLTMVSHKAMYSRFTRGARAASLTLRGPDSTPGYAARKGTLVYRTPRMNDGGGEARLG